MSKVLLVEDDEMLVEMYSDKFKKVGFEVDIARNGEEGLQKMQSFQPHIVLLDLIMPKSGGFDVISKAINDPALKSIPIIVLTNIYANKEDLLKNQNVNMVLMKSEFTPDQVVSKIVSVLTAKSLGN